MEEGRTISPDVVDLRSFYAERLGTIAQRLIAARVGTLWPTRTGDRVLGIGYATPFLSALAGGAERVLAFMPAAQGVMNWSDEGGNLAALVHEDVLPLTDASIDRILAVHCLETTANVRDLLRELWRVLVPGGRLIHRGAEPARHLGPRRADALRLWPSVQPQPDLKPAARHAI